MMSQNRQEAKDRFRSQHDDQVNLKAELRLREHLASFEWPTSEECPLEVAMLRAQLGFAETEPA